MYLANGPISKSASAEYRVDKDLGGIGFNIEQGFVIPDSQEIVAYEAPYQQVIRTRGGSRSVSPSNLSS